MSVSSGAIFPGGSSRAGQGECRGRFKGKGEGWMVQGQGLRWFKGKAKGGSRVNAGAIEKEIERLNYQGHGGRRLRQYLYCGDLFY